ncbi:MAG: hypothetical protein COU27_00100, partial [Candidatus Levybacteria bacterium CG10_big_fil_rev_8_21_14_0_10_36_7]
EGAKMSRHEALAEIRAIMSQVSVMGGNDFEIPALENIMTNVESGEISPEEGVHQAQNIADSKSSDYH